MVRSVNVRLVVGCLAASAAWCSATVRAAEWKPAQGPLMTRWGQDVSPENAHPEYPRPQMVRRQWQSLNGLWQFRESHENEPLPQDWTGAESILVPFPVESALSGVMRRMERLWYRRAFETPVAWQGQRVLLHFGAVDWQATVYVNGQRLTTHEGGYDRFSLDITDALKPAGRQELIVGVYDPTDGGTQPIGKQLRKPNGIWYTPTTGIWQSVWMEPVPPSHITELRLVPDVDAGSLQATVRVAGAADGATLRLTARDGEALVATADGRPGEQIALPIPDAKPWGPGHPHLYDLTAELVQGDAISDVVDSYFGMRKVSLGKVDGVTRILVNGEPIFQVGPLDQGFWPDGLYTAPTDEALRYDLEITQKLGFNMTRKHVKVEPERWYYWCDKLGLLVWQDMPHGMKSPKDPQVFEGELDRMMEDLWNHPSIIMWVPFNEGWGQYDTPRITERVKQKDPSRLVNSASGWFDKKTGDVNDIHRYPGPGAPEPEQSRAIALGEFGGLGLAVQDHLWVSDKNWSYRGMADREQLTYSYLGLLKETWRLAHQRGLSAAVYTQITDVEIEINGLLTYDRQIVKVDERLVRDANQGRFPQERVLVAASDDTPQTWRYTLTAPDKTWTTETFDDGDWNTGSGGFGTAGTPGATIGTTWDGKEIWLRREFTLPEELPAAPLFRCHHDENVQIFVNGVPAAAAGDYTTEYQLLPMSGEAKAALKPGKNILAVHCKQTAGGQYIDVGLVELK